MIGSNIRVVVVGVRGKSTRLGIEADDETLILREEVFENEDEDQVITAPHKRREEVAYNTLN